MGRALVHPGLLFDTFVFGELGGALERLGGLFVPVDLDVAQPHVDELLDVDALGAELALVEQIGQDARVDQVDLARVDGEFGRIEVEPLGIVEPLTLGEGMVPVAAPVGIARVVVGHGHPM